MAERVNTNVTYIRPVRGWININLRDLWLYRELVYFLTWRDIKVRYKQALLGIGWAIFQPVLSMVIFTVIFNRFLGVKPDSGIPNEFYPIFGFAALLPWQFFQGALQRASVSLVTNANLLTKVYFPRLIIPLSAVAAGLVDFLFSFIVLAAMMLYFGVPFTARLLWLPLFLLLALLAALAVGLWLSALNVQYRDVQHMVPFLLTAWMYASPVVYSAEVITVSPSGRRFTPSTRWSASFRASAGRCSAPTRRMFPCWFRQGWCWFCSFPVCFTSGAWSASLRI